VSRRRAALWLALAAALFALARALRPEMPAQPASAALAPEDAGAALFLGGFRAIAADALWVRLIDRWEAGAFEEVVPLAQAILALDPRSERAWSYAAWTLAVNLPALEREDARWPWIRQGILLAREGARKNPASWALRFEEGYLVWQEIVRARDPALGARFQADRAADPEGVPPLEYARRRFAEAGALEGHPIYVDWKLVRASIDAGRPDEARRALAHVRAAHPAANPEQIRDFEREIDSAR
jgi:hypothetical protein